MRTGYTPNTGFTDFTVKLAAQIMRQGIRSSEIEIMVTTIAKFIIRFFVAQTDAGQITFTMTGTDTLQLPVHIISDSSSSQIPCQGNVIPLTRQQQLLFTGIGKFPVRGLHLQLLVRKVSITDTHLEIHLNPHNRGYFRLEAIHPYNRFHRHGTQVIHNISCRTALIKSRNGDVDILQVYCRGYGTGATHQIIHGT